MKSQNLNKLVHTLHTLGIVRCTEIWTLAHIFDSNFKSTAGSFSSRLDNRTRQYSVLMKKTTGAWTWSGNRPMKFWHKSTYYSIIMAVAMETWKRNGKKLHWGGKKKKKKKRRIQDFHSVVVLLGVCSQVCNSNNGPEHSCNLQLEETISFLSSLLVRRER